MGNCKSEIEILGSDSFGGINEVLQDHLREVGQTLPADFPDLGALSEWNTLPHGEPAACRRGLILDVYAESQLPGLLAAALHHVGLHCNSVTTSLVLVVSVDTAAWAKFWNLYEPAFRGISPILGIEIFHLKIPDCLVGLESALAATTSGRSLSKWISSVKGWDEERKRRFCLAIFSLRHDATYLGRTPKIVGRYNTPPFSNQPLLVFGEIINEKFVSNTNSLRFKIDGTEYAKKTGSRWYLKKI